ncbi:hypothetical protein HPB51_022188 [Rhipicephalus microplus]|uniref:Uncharacterized protein n=1 Tax=Rhipicephalus microplus TaxID=6941 RepID=A0A9J6F8H7_RHIMP|nr:hypothetical protein HPB51_022188 [Rhipicephalus microplus]
MCSPLALSISEETGTRRISDTDRAAGESVALGPWTRSHAGAARDDRAATRRERTPPVFARCSELTHRRCARPAGHYRQCCCDRSRSRASASAAQFAALFFSGFWSAAIGRLARKGASLLPRSRQAECVITPKTTSWASRYRVQNRMELFSNARGLRYDRLDADRDVVCCAEPTAEPRAPGLCPEQPLKVVLVGDNRCGKTALANRFVSDVFTTGPWHTTLCGHYRTKDASVVLLCFNVGVPESLHNVIHKWQPEVRQHCPGASLLLIGCQSDARMVQRGGCVSADEALTWASRLGAVAYVGDERPGRTSKRARCLEGGRAGRSRTRPPRRQELPRRVPLAP